MAENMTRAAFDTTTWDLDVRGGWRGGQDGNIFAGIMTRMSVCPFGVAGCNL